MDSLISWHGPAFDLHLGRSILDDFQGWGFRPVFEFVHWILISRVPCVGATGAHQSPNPSKAEWWGTQQADSDLSILRGRGIPRERKTRALRKNREACGRENSTQPQNLAHSPPNVQSSLKHAATRREE
jgi:hypothetical protein